MIELIKNIIIFIFLWFTMCGLWHEIMHILECIRQGSTDAYTWIEFIPLPSMKCTCSDVYSSKLVKLAGGLYTSILCFLLVFVFKGFISWTFLTLGFVQFIYGIFETIYLHNIPPKTYRNGRYAIYVITVCVMMLIYLYMKL